MTIVNVVLLSMMNGFENLITKVSEDLRQTAVWGKTDVENYKFNFTALHLMSSLNVEDQNRLFSACTESAKKGITFPTKEEFKRIKEYYNKNKPDKTIDDAIEDIDFEEEYTFDDSWQDDYTLYDM